MTALNVPATNNKLLDAIQAELPPLTATRLAEATKAIVQAKERGGKVVVVTGSGPNIHEGVTTLIAALISKEIVDGVLTSSAVIAHELAGSLDKVKRFPGAELGLALQEPMTYSKPPAGKYFLPRGEVFEITELTEQETDTISADFPVDREFLNRAGTIEGKVIIKAAGNMAYPMGPRTELLASTLLKTCKKKREPLEAVAGPGADPMTMIGAASTFGVPVLVSIPQMVGGGNVGICIGDSISIKERCERVARLLGGASVIVESALALAQEIHDGPFETYTGHGIWAPVTGTPTYTLRDKHLIRIDLDPALQAVWEKERAGGDVQKAIDDGKPKTKLFNVPFRMEMSGFARLERSTPIVGDIGALWPLLARGVAEGLGKRLDFTSYPQGTPEGQAMREWIVENVAFFDLARFNARTRG
ncbi:MAG: deoxyhypusine synthase family protein [Candidatus Lokiarchaeota archaeon]|nr:deoxyhypusine synthase family protein [Candidatus Lokiarchaeota archaeon]